MTDDLQERAREAASDLAFTLGNRVELTDDCRTAINQAFLAFASPTPEPSGAVVEALRQIANWSDDAIRHVSCAFDMRATARTALASLDAGGERG